VIEDVKNVVLAWRSRGEFIDLEVYYCLGSALLLAEAVKQGGIIHSNDAEIVLSTVRDALYITPLEENIASILKALSSLRDIAPHFFVSCLREASEYSALEEDTVNFIYNSIIEILGKHLDKLEKHVWPLLDAVMTCSKLLTYAPLRYLDELKIEELIKRITELIEKLKDHRQLHALAHAYVTGHLLDLLAIAGVAGRSLELGIDLVKKAEELIEILKHIEQEEPDVDTKKYIIESFSLLKNVKEAFKGLVKDLKGGLLTGLGLIYLLDFELEKAREKFKDATEIFHELGEIPNYLSCRRRDINCSVLGSKTINELSNVMKEYDDLWQTTVKFMEYRLRYLEKALEILVNYIVYLAIKGKREDIYSVLDDYEWLLKRDPFEYALIKLLLKYFDIDVETPSSNEVEILLSEHESDWYNSNSELIEKALRGDKKAIKELKTRVKDLLKGYKERALQSGRLRGLLEPGDIENLYKDLLGFIDKRDISDVVTLCRPGDVGARMIMILEALIKGDEELARAHGAVASISSPIRRFTKLFYDVYDAIKARDWEELKLALVKNVLLMSFYWNLLSVLLNS
jgi:tetratricopeptide (TPR) repeat protein